MFTAIATVPATNFRRKCVSCVCWSLQRWEVALLMSYRLLNWLSGWRLSSMSLCFNTWEMIATYSACIIYFVPVGVVYTCHGGDSSIYSISHRVLNWWMDEKGLLLPCKFENLRNEKNVWSWYMICDKMVLFSSRHAEFNTSSIYQLWLTPKYYYTTVLVSTS